MDTWVPLLIALAVLMAITVTVLGVAHVPKRWAAPPAVARGAVQLLLLGLVLRGVLTNGWWVALALAVMFGVAATTSSRRLGLAIGQWPIVAGAMLAGAAVAIGVVFGVGALAVSPRYVLALGGIVVGNTMTIATLTGRRFRIGTHDRWEEVEGWLALGATPRESTALIRREAICEALIPTIDQTRTTGLVTLPGAFVGSLFGGASPLDAGRFQILVLACVLAAGAITAVLLLTGLAAVRTKPTRPG